MTDRARQFADELQRLEQSRDVGAFVTAVFSEDVELLRPETGQQASGHEGARHFWEQYLDYFDTIASEFSRVQDGEVGVLEWTSSGRLRGGSDVSYRGVSLLDYADDGLVDRFSTYYDTSAFHPDAPAVEV